MEKAQSFLIFQIKLAAPVKPAFSLSFTAFISGTPVPYLPKHSFSIKECISSSKYSFLLNKLPVFRRSTSIISF